MTVAVRISAIERTLLDALERGDDPAAAWLSYRDDHADVLDYYEQVFGSPEQNAEASGLGAGVAAQAAELRRREAALALDVVAPKVAELLELSDGKTLDAVTFVGWGRAIAWCDDESDDPRAYFALERLPPNVDQIRVIAAHELGHLAHIELRSGAWPAWSIGLGIAMEGIAVSTARQIVPGVSPAGQLNVQPGALEAYASHRAAIHAEVLSLVDAVDEGAFRRVMFPPWLCDGDVAGVNEVGYGIAWALADAWRARGITVAQAARCTPQEARADLVAVLTA